MTRQQQTTTQILISVATMLFGGCTMQDDPLIGGTGERAIGASCNSDNDCASGEFCRDDQNTCRVQKDDDLWCNRDRQCLSGLCNDEGSCEAAPAAEAEVRLESLGQDLWLQRQNAADGTSAAGCGGNNTNNVRLIDKNMTGTWTTWILEPTTGEFFHIVSAEDGKVLQATNEVDATDPNAFAVRMVEPCNGTWTQWRKVEVGGGVFRLENRETGLWLQGSNASDADSGNGQQVRLVPSSFTGTWTQWREVAAGGDSGGEPGHGGHGGHGGSGGVTVTPNGGPSANTAPWLPSANGTCNDGWKNQGESGVDCGGPCNRRCGNSDGGTWRTVCTVHTTAFDDPIVFPDQPGASHHHDFLGAQPIDASSTYWSLKDSGRTSCRAEEAKAAYWHPVLYADGRRTTPDRVNNYYRTFGDAASVTPYPQGLRVIAGNPMAQTAAENPHVRWFCVDGDGRRRVDTPRDCRSNEDLLKLLISFPDCWDGERLDSPDHQSHMAYVNNNDECPASHPVQMASLELSVNWDFQEMNRNSTFELASGGIHSGHADFINTWEEQALARIVANCLRNDADCTNHQIPSGPAAMTPRALDTRTYGR